MTSSEQVISDATIERLDEKRIRLKWSFNRKSHSISIFKAGIADSKPAVPVVENPEGTETIIADNPASPRSYYLLKPENAPGIWTAERRVIMEGLVNFRDLGGYQTTGGERIRWGMIYRGDSLQRANDADKERFRQLNIQEVYDFRRDDEVEKSPNRFPEEHPVHYHHMPVAHGEFNFMTAMERLKKNSADTIDDKTIINGYLDNTVKYATTWGAVISRLAEDDCPPLFFHCTAGKDRTGICAALLLSALDVPEETIKSDYLLSNRYIRDVWLRVEKMIEEQGIDPEKLKPFFTAPEYAIDAMLQYLNSNFGSVVGFLHEKADVKTSTINLLKTRLLER